MFSILQKPQETVNAEDLESLQNELEKRLIKVVTRRWELERELLALNSTSPDLTLQNTATSTSNNNNSSSSGNLHHHSGKLRTSHRINLIEHTDNSTDGFKSNLFGATNNIAAGGSVSGTNSTEDSVSSEGSIVSGLTSSTIITTADSGSHTQTTNSASNNNNQTTSGIKRSNKSTSNDRPSKRFKQQGNNSLNQSSVHTKRPSHSKHRSKIVPSKFRNSSLEESRPFKKQILGNEAPDKLWPFVEQFCAIPTTKQIFELEEMIKAMENDKEYFKVPALGKRESHSKDLSTKLDSSSSSSVKNQKKSKIKIEDEEASLGALTQRLVSSFIEESAYNGLGKGGDSEAGSQSKKKNVKSKANGKSIDMNNAKNLERRIRQGLEDYEILDQQDDIPYTSEEDEVLRELVASQHELLTIQNQNKDSMQRLLKKARKHVELEGERAKLREANAEVIAAYQRLIQAKQRKRNPTKKEKDAAWKALKIQEAIFKKCDELYLSSLNRFGDGGGGGGAAV